MKNRKKYEAHVEMRYIEMKFSENVIHKKVFKILKFSAKIKNEETKNNLNTQLE